MTIEEIPEKRSKKSKKEKKSQITDKSSTESDPNKNGLLASGNIEANTGENVKKERKEKKRKRKESEEDGDGDGERSHKKSKKSHRREKGEDTTGTSTPLETPPDTDKNGAGEQENGEKKKKKKKKDKDSHPATTLEIPDTVQNIPQFLQDNAITIHGNLTPILSFAQLDIPEELRLCLQGFKAPTPIQACSWPALMAGQDFVGIAETGSGKTLAFGLPALARLAKSERPPQGKKINVLVVAPTRELAIQTHDTLLATGQPLGITSVCLYGGVDKEGQRKLLKDKRLRIVVGTPGRLLDLANEGVCDFSHVTYLVLDEADRMLDKGFENDIRQIIGKTTPGANRQTLMFSATWPDSVRRLAASFQRDPIRVTVGQDDLMANRRVEQVIEVFDDPWQKDGKLLNVLKQVQKKSITPGSDESRTLVFVLYKNEAPRVETLLLKQGYSVRVLHGNISQDARMKALDDFKTGKVGILIATDVAARGLDIPNVGTVINYTFPLTVEDYVHRIGRTGRGGREGKSITFFTGEKHEKALAGELMKVVREAGFESAAQGLRKFPMTLKKKEHGAYGAHFKEIDSTVKGTKIVF